MANRLFLPFLGCLEVDVVELFGSCVIGASGAVSSYSGKGITSITRLSAGKYSVNMADRYNLFLYGSCNLLDDTNSDPATVGVHNRLFSEAVNNATPAVVFQFIAMDDGAAADPAAGATLYFNLKVRNSSVS